MNTEPSTTPPPETLARDHWDIPIRVRLVPYVAFGHWLDEELEKFVAQWQDQAAPCAMKSRR